MRTLASPLGHAALVTLLYLSRNTLNMSLYFLLIYMVSDKFREGFPLLRPPAPGYFKDFRVVFGFQQFECDMPRHHFFGIHSAWCSLSSLDLM